MKKAKAKAERGLVATILSPMDIQCCQESECEEKDLIMSAKARVRGVSVLRSTRRYVLRRQQAAVLQRQPTRNNQTPLRRRTHLQVHRHSRCAWVHRIGSINLIFRQIYGAPQAKISRIRRNCLNMTDKIR